MLKKLFITAAFLVPTSVLAFTWSAETPFVDVKKTSPEAVSINLLFQEGVLVKKENARVYPSRLVNRAEFLKMAMLASAGTGALQNPSHNCFTDVPKDAWFAPFICSAKENGIVSGNGNTFFPERSVQYDEALKMLTLLYRYSIIENTTKDWATPYYNAAKERGVDLSQRIRFDTRLTRGMAARLIAAFLTESRGELIHLRLAESGHFDLIPPQHSSSTSSESSASSVSSSSASSESSVSSSPFSSPDTRSHFLLLGTVSKPLATITIPEKTEKHSVAIAKVVLTNEVRSIESLQVIREDGIVLATLLKRTTSDLPEYKRIYEAQVPAENQISLPVNIAQKLILRAIIRSAVEGGISDELLSIQSFSVSLRGEQSNETFNIVAPPPFSKHQTAFGMSPSLEKISLPSQSILSGTGKILYQIKATVPDVPTREFALRQIQWKVQMQNITLSNITLFRVGNTPIACSMNTNEMTITCVLTQSTIGLLSSNTTPFTLKADALLDSGQTSGSLMLSLPFAGSPNEAGSIQWTDSSGKFQWIETVSPVLPSEIITVTK